MVRLYRGQVPKLSAEIIQILIASGDLEIELAKIPEAEKDIGSVMEEYLRNDMKVLNRAKDILSARRLSREAMGKVRREVAAEYNHQLGEEGTRWMQHQIIECLVATPNVEEVYGDDVALLKRIREGFDRVLVSEDVLDAEVRGRMKNLREGTPEFELKYQEVMREVRLKYGLIKPREKRSGPGQRGHRR